MSLVKISGNASGTGTLTIAAPNTNTDYTLTLPTNTGTILTGSSAITASQLPAGSVLQVVQTVKTDTATLNVTTSANLDITGMSVSITPSSSSNKILIFAQVSLSQVSADISGIVLVRDSTEIGVGDANGNRNRNTSGFWTGGGTNELVTVPIMFLDSPATTSSTTYKLQISKATGATRTYYLNRNARYSDFGYDGTYMSSITVMEIAA
jgi:hypothetical protein